MQTDTQTIETTKCLRGNVALSSGRIVRHERMSNGATHAFIAETATGEMTENEWNEYVFLIKGI